MWTSSKVNASAIRTVLRHRYGQFWNKKLARRQRRPYFVHAGSQPASDDRCPLCGLPDSSGHILGGCEQRQMRAMYIARHDKAVGSITKALHRGSAGGSYTVMDACKERDLAAHDVDAKRLPGWLVPSVAREERSRMRPDILRVLGLPAAPSREQIERATTSKHRHTVQIVVVGYTADTRWQENLKQKERQHEALETALRAAGWSVETHILLVGNIGTVYIRGLKALVHLGLRKMEACALLGKLSVHSALVTHDISIVRRRMERVQARAGVG